MVNSKQTNKKKFLSIVVGVTLWKKRSYKYELKIDFDINDLKISYKTGSYMTQSQKKGIWWTNKV